MTLCSSLNDFRSFQGNHVDVRHALIECLDDESFVLKDLDSSQVSKAFSPLLNRWKSVGCLPPTGHLCQWLPNSRSGHTFGIWRQNSFRLCWSHLRVPRRFCRPGKMLEPLQKISENSFEFQIFIRWYWCLNWNVYFKFHYTVHFSHVCLK